MGDKLLAASTRKTLASAPIGLHIHKPIPANHFSEKSSIPLCFHNRQLSGKY
jgi:hypothetical protein